MWNEIISRDISYILHSIRRQFKFSNAWTVKNIWFIFIVLKINCDSSEVWNFFSNSNFDYSVIRWKLFTEKLFFYVCISGFCFQWHKSDSFYEVCNNQIIYEWYLSMTFYIHTKIIYCTNGSKYVIYFRDNDEPFIVNVSCEEFGWQRGPVLFTKCPPFNFEKCYVPFIRNKEVARTMTHTKKKGVHSKEYDEI
jgi:hypothetical protein